MYTISFTAAMKQDAKRMKKRGKNMQLLQDVIEALASGSVLEERYRDHALGGKLAGTRECHIEPDWLLIYEIRESELRLIATRTGTHADLFKK